MKSDERVEKERALLRCLAMGSSLVAACAGAGIERSTFEEWVAADAALAAEVRVSRVGMVEEAMCALRLLASGRFVEEEKVVESARGTRREKRKRWVNGKVSACMALLRMVEEDLVKPAVKAKAVEKAVKEKVEEPEEAVAAAEAGLAASAEAGRVEPVWEGEGERPEDWNVRYVVLFEGEEDDDPTHGAEYDEGGRWVKRIVFRRDWTGLSEERIAEEKQWDLDRIAEVRRERAALKAAGLPGGDPPRIPYLQYYGDTGEPEGK